MIVSILGKCIRANLHRQTGEALQPVIAVWDGETVEYGLGAILHDNATIHYDLHTQLCYGECWIETGDNLTLYQSSIEQPSLHGYFIHTNTNHAKSNSKTLRERRDLPLQQVLAVRSKRHAPAQLTSIINTQSPLWIIYACPQNTLKPLPCGARVWGFTIAPPLIDGAPPTKQLTLF